MGILELSWKYELKARLDVNPMKLIVIIRLGRWMTMHSIITDKRKIVGSSHCDPLHDWWPMIQPVIRYSLNPLYSQARSERSWITSGVNAEARL